MPNYKESNISGVEWQRCHTIKINNQLNLTQKIEFEEEKVLDIGGKYFHEWVAGCSKEFQSTNSFPLLNTNTNQPIGQNMTHEQLYQAIYSLYMQTASERDAGLT